MGAHFIHKYFAAECANDKQRMVPDIWKRCPHRNVKKCQNVAVKNPTKGTRRSIVFIEKYFDPDRRVMLTKFRLA